MGRIEITCRLMVPVQEAFDFIANGDNAPLWHASIQEAHHITPMPIQVGSRLSLRAQVGKREFTWTQEVTEWAPGVSFRDRMVEGEAPFKHFEDWGKFISKGEGTEVTFGVHYTLKGGPFGWLVDRLFVLPRVRNETRESLMKVETLLRRRRSEGSAGPPA